MTTNPWGITPAAQAAQWSQQYGTGTGSSANPSWEIARKALEKLSEGSGEASGGEGSGKDSSSPDKKAGAGKSTDGDQDKRPKQQDIPGPVNQHPPPVNPMNNMNMYGNYYQQYGGGGSGMYPGQYPPYGPGYGMPPQHHMRGPYPGMQGYPPHQGGMYPPYRQRPPFNEHRGPGFPPQGPRGPPGIQPPPPPPPHKMGDKSRDSPSPPQPSPSPSSKPASAPSRPSQVQVSGDSDGAGGGGGRGRGGQQQSYAGAPKFRPGHQQQLHTGSSWNKNYNQPVDSQGIRFSLPSKRQGMHPSPMVESSPGGQGAYQPQQQKQKQQQHSFGSKKAGARKQETSAASQQPKKQPSAPVNPSDWPPGLKDYVQRAFSSCQNETEKDKVESHLKKILTEAHNQGTVMTKDWTQEPLPLSNNNQPSANPKPQLQEAPWSAGRGREFPDSPARRQGAGRGGRGRGRGRGRGQWEKNRDRSPDGPPGRMYPGRVAEPARGRHGRKIFGFSRDSLYSSDSDSSRSYSRSRSRSRSPSSRSRRRGRRHREERDRSPRSPRSPDLRNDYLPLSAGKKGKGKGRGRGRGRGRGWEREKEDDGDKMMDRRNERTPGKKGQKGQKGKNRNVGNVDYVDDRERSMRMQKRAARFQDMLGEEDGQSGGGGGKKQRTQKLSLQINEVLTGDSEDTEWSMEPIVGTSQDLWKQYLRLTSAPDPCQVRPVSVLRKSLVKVKERWKTKQDYNFVCEQLKSIRQDLTIQCVRNEFSVEVYETHGRIALEKGDVAEFNQCQTQLKALYGEGMPGNIHEFQAYQILYYIYMENTMEMNTALAHLEPASREDPLVNHALSLRSAWAMSDYHKFFKLYRTAPRMGSYVIDMFLARERTNAVKAIIKSFRPSVPVEYVANSLAFLDTDECLAFLEELGAVLSADRTKLDCKQSTTAMAAAGAN